MDSETDATQTVVGSIESAAPRAKRPCKEADKRRARVQDLHNKYADINFSRYQDTHADQYPPTLACASKWVTSQGSALTSLLAQPVGMFTFLEFSFCELPIQRFSGANVR